MAVANRPDPCVSMFRLLFLPGHGPGLSMELLSLGYPNDLLLLAEGHLLPRVTHRRSAAGGTTHFVQNETRLMFARHIVFRGMVGGTAVSRGSAAALVSRSRRQNDLTRYRAVAAIPGQNIMVNNRRMAQVTCAI